MASLFSVVGTVLVRPQFLGNAEEKFFAASFERDALLRKQQQRKKRLSGGSLSPANGHSTSSSFIRQRKVSHGEESLMQRRTDDVDERLSEASKRAESLG
jgi:hypothetical protein